jgi:hypothetical protein
MQPLRHGPAAGWSGAVGAGPTTVDEASMERSKSFIKALQVRCISLLHPHFQPRSPHFPTRAHGAKKGMIFIPTSSLVLRFLFLSSIRWVLDGGDLCVQELKNLRSQLYSASEYCEKSYLHSEQKQM